MPPGVAPHSRLRLAIDGGARRQVDQSERRQDCFPGDALVLGNRAEQRVQGTDTHFVMRWDRDAVRRWIGGLNRPGFAGGSKS